VLLPSLLLLVSCSPSSCRLNRLLFRRLFCTWCGISGIDKILVEDNADGSITEPSGSGCNANANADDTENFVAGGWHKTRATNKDTILDLLLLLVPNLLCRRLIISNWDQMVQQGKVLGFLFDVHGRESSLTSRGGW
jgi:hypothetical protein